MPGPPARWERRTVQVGKHAGCQRVEPAVVSGRGETIENNLQAWGRGCGEWKWGIKTFGEGGKKKTGDGGGWHCRRQEKDMKK